MASEVNLLKSFFNGQGAGASTYTVYPEDLDSNFTAIENLLNQLVAEFNAFSGSGALLSLDLALSSSPSVSEGIVGTDSFAPVSFLTADTQIQVPTGVAYTAAGGRVQTTQTFTFTGSGASGTRYIALNVNGTLTQETASGQGVLDLYSVTWDGAQFTTVTLARLPITGSIIVDGDDFQGSRAQEDSGQSTSAALSPFTFDRIQYRLDDVVRLLAGIPSGGTRTSSQAAGSGAAAGPTIKPLAIGGSVATPGVIVGDGSSYATTSGLFGDPATAAIGVSVEATEAVRWDETVANQPQTLLRAGTALATPPLAFSGDPDTGIRWLSADRFALGGNAANVAEVRGDVPELYTPVLRADGGVIPHTQVAENVQTGSSYSVVAGDRGAAIVANNGTAITLNLLAASAAGAGFTFYVKNIGAGNATIDPNSSELIEGQSTISLGTDEGCIVWCNGTGWRTVGYIPGGRREVLTAARDYYVRADGDDANDGLADSSGGAFLTLQRAVDVVAGLDLSIYAVTIHVGSGTFAGVTVSAPFIGGPGSSVTISGDTTTPSNVVLSSVFRASDRATIAVEGVDFTTSGNGIEAERGGTVIVSGPVVFGVCSSNHVFCKAGTVSIQSDYTIDGGAFAHGNAAYSGFVQFQASIEVTTSGTPAFSGAFVYAQTLAAYEANNLVFSGSGATGSRYNASGNSVIFTAGAGATYFPGDAAGSTATGGQYF